MKTSKLERPSDLQHMQEQLAAKVCQVSSIEPDQIGLIAGCDVAYHKESDQLVAAFVVLDRKLLKVVDQSIFIGEAEYPYIPGLFSFRELPPLLEAYAKLKVRPDVIICDGQGFAHPRRFGLACHLGVELDLPTVGCAKTKLVGEFSELNDYRGSYSSLIDGTEIIGNVLRTQSKVKPVFVSVGHHISLEHARELVLSLCPKYRMPETTRQADQLVNKTLKSLSKQVNPNSSEADSDRI